MVVDFIPTRHAADLLEAERSTAPDAAVGMLRVYFDETASFVLAWLTGFGLGILGMWMGTHVSKWFFGPEASSETSELAGALLATALCAPLIIWLLARRPRSYVLVQFGPEVAVVSYDGWRRLHPTIDWIERPAAATFRPRPAGLAQRVLVDDLILFTRDRGDFARAQAILNPPGGPSGAAT